MAVAFLAACSSSTTSNGGGGAASGTAKTASAGGSAKPAICTSVADLKASLQSLKGADIKANGLSAISDDITKIKQELNTIKADAHGQYSTQVNALSDALSGLSTSFDAAKASPNAGTLTTLGTSAHSVVTAGNNLVSAVSGAC
jgi:uncharacterized phage infection (PIP) family protein YhgE